MPDLGIVVVKNRYPVTKIEKSFHFDLTQVAHDILDPVTSLFRLYHFSCPSIFNWLTEDEGSGTFQNLCSGSGYRK